MNEVVIPYKVKDTFNAIQPKQGRRGAAVRPEPELAATLKNVCGINAPAKNRDDLVPVFLTGVPGLNNPKGNGTPSEKLRLNTKWQAGQTSNRLGVSAVTTTGSPTVAGCRTTSSTSRCRSSAASSRACRTTSATP